MANMSASRPCLVRDTILYSRKRSVIAVAPNGFASRQRDGDGSARVHDVKSKRDSGSSMRIGASWLIARATG